MPSGPSPEERELVAFIERDYAVTQEATASAENAVVASRSIGFTLVAALLGVGLSQRSWVIVALAALTGFAAYMIDGYYTWRATDREQYLRGLERVLAANYVAIERAPNNAKELSKLATRLEGARVGANSQIRRFRYRDAWFNPPAMLFKFLYPVLIVAAITATGIFAVRALTADDEDGGRRSECEHPGPRPRPSFSELEAEGPQARVVEDAGGLVRVHPRRRQQGLDQGLSQFVAAGRDQAN